MKSFKRAQTLRVVFLILIRCALLALILYGANRIYQHWRLLPEVSLERILKDYTFNIPVMIRESNDGQKFIVVERFGLIRWFGKGNDQVGTLLDISQKVYSDTWEEGLFSIAFDPDFQNNRSYYVFYSLKDPFRSRISRFRLNEDWSSDIESEQVILELGKPRLTHNGGMLEFGRDGYLYASFGDSDITKDPGGPEALNSRETLYGSIIRIDVSDPSVPYRIPADNPFVNDGPKIKKEIWAYGFRNPWRFGFYNDQIYVNDVGHSRYEEVSILEKGGHHGWPLMEADKCRYSRDHGKCHQEGKVFPIARFSHKDGIECTTGGAFYKGRYVMADLRGGILAFDLPDEDDVVTRLDWLHPPFEVHDKRPGEPLNITSLHEIKSGELYITTMNKIFKIESLENPIGWLEFLKSMFRWAL